MERIFKFMSGEMDIKDFIKQLLNDKELQEKVDALIPPEAITDRQHPIWKQATYDVYKNENFSCMNYLRRICKFDNTCGDNLDMFYTIFDLFSYNYPDFKCTERYREIFGLYLDVIQDCFDGPEVNHVVEAILNETLNIAGKTKRKAFAKARIKEVFHVEGRERPYWIQGPEWPMGENSPMKFISKKRKDETVWYFFKDVDTGTEKAVEQYY